MRPSFLPKLFSPGASRRTSSTVTSLEALSGQSSSTLQCGLSPFGFENCLFQLKRTTPAHGIRDVSALEQSQARGFLVLRMQYSYRRLTACGWLANRHSISYGPLFRSYGESVVTLPWCSSQHFCAGYPASSVHTDWCTLSHRHISISEFDKHNRLQDTTEHADVTACALLLQQYVLARDLPALRFLHRQIIIHAFERLDNMERLLLHAYGKLGMAMDALTVFGGLDEPDSALWNFVIGSCAKHSEQVAAFQLYAHMQSQGHLPDQYLYSSILSACSSEADLRIGKLLHARIIASSFADDVVVVTALVNMYGKCCSVHRANMVFASMQNQDVVSWNAIIAAHVQHGDGRGAIQLYEIMHNEGFIPNKVTFTSILSACADVEALNKGTHLHAQVLGTDFKMNMIMATSLVDMYVKCGRTLAARHLFDSIDKEDTIIWNAMISGYAQNGQGNDALKLFQQMRREKVRPTKATFIPTLEACMNERALVHGREMHVLVKQLDYEADVMVGTALVMMYGKCGSMGEAFVVFDKLINRTIVSWNALITCFAQGGLGSEVLQLFEQMLGEGVIPDKVTFLNILPLCSNHATLVECKRMHSSIAQSKLESDDNFRAGLVNVYGKLGRMEDALRVINSCPRSSSVSLWTAVIAAWSQARSYDNALQCFCQMLMEGVLPDKVATISIFAAIANQGSLVKGLHVHACNIGTNLDSEIDVQNAIFSMYGKCGSIQAAQVVFMRMITRDAISFRAIIAILVQFDQLAEAIDVFWQMLYEGIAPDNVIMATSLNLCGSTGALTQGLKLHACMSDHFNSDDLLVGTALLSMYACCGCLDSAWRIFRSLRVRELSTWSCMMEACAFHGEGRATISLFEHMQNELVTPERNTIAKLLLACSHGGLVDEGGYTFHYFRSEFLIDHYNCMIDLLGRAGQVEEAEEIVKRMPIRPNAMSWSSLLAGCRLSSDVDRGEFAARYIVELEPECAATYISLANIYAAAGALELAVLNEVQ